MRSSERSRRSRALSERAVDARTGWFLSTWAAILWLTTSSAGAQPAHLRVMPDRMPSAIFKQMVTHDKLIGSPGLAWRQRAVTVAFKGGDDSLYALIESAASEWTALGGELQLSFRDDAGHFRHWTTEDVNPAADVRVSFDDVGDLAGYWSVVGVMAQNIAAKEPTMNLGGFIEALAPYLHGQNSTAWLASYEHSVILHEFGHALGLSHEHFNPQCQADLKLSMVITSLMEPPNGWSEEQAKFNMDAGYYFNVLADQAGPLDTHPVSSSSTDRTSVMLYPFTDDFYQSGAASPCKPAGALGYATTLSNGDRQFFLNNYAHISSAN